MKFPLDSKIVAIVGGSTGIGLATATARLMPPDGPFVFTGGLSAACPIKGAWVSGIVTAAAEQLVQMLVLELAPRPCNAILLGWTGNLDGGEIFPK